MILGLSLQNFTLLHVIISLIGIVTGFVVVFGMLKGERMGVWTALFLVTTILTTATGFLFPSAAFTPALAVGYVSSAVLIVTLLALYVFRLAGPWRWIYVIGALVALYLNTFVGVVQSFQKISFVNGLAPTQSEPPFIIAQSIVFAIFVVLGYFAIKRFHPAPIRQRAVHAR